LLGYSIDAVVVAGRVGRVEAVRLTARTSYCNLSDDPTIPTIKFPFPKPAPLPDASMVSVDSADISGGGLDIGHERIA
jgi:hypothetical protein